MMFYKETNFKETPIGKIPKDWEVVKLETILNLKNGERPKISEIGNIPVYGANGIMGYTTEFLVDNDFTIVIGRVGASGEIHLGKGKIWISDNAIYSKTYNKLKVHLPFLFYLLKSKRLSQFALKTTHPIITQTFLKIFLIQRPELPEQQKIAEIFSTIDEAIQKTNEVIAKTERLKKGLMQELLTKGIGHKEFKDTEIGRIPKDWNILAAEDVCGRVTDGTHDTPKPVEKGYFLVTSKHIKDGNIDFSEAYFISEDDFIEVNKRSKVDVGDVLFSMIGTVGMTAIVKKEYPPFAIKNVGLFKTRGNFTLALWLHYYFQSQYAQKYINNNLKGTTQKYIPLYALRKFPITLPHFSEQQKITEILSSIDKKLALERKEKAKLERIKQGLMDLLLTGKIRVKVN